MTSVKFKRSSTEIEIMGPVYSNQPVDGPSRFVTAIAADGTPYSYTLNGSSYRVWRMQFDLTNHEYADLENFYFNVALGPTHEFTFTCTAGQSYTVRFADTKLSPSRLGPYQWSVSVSLLVNGSIVTSDGSGS